MTIRLYWEDVIEGGEIPPLTKIATTQTLVQWAGASGDFNPLHFEDSFANSQGVGKPIIHGQLKRAWLVHLLTAWIGEGGRIKRFSCQFRVVDYPRLMETMVDAKEGETWQCKGVVTKKYIETGEKCVDCEIWLENGRGEKTTSGRATVTLPFRDSG